MQKTEKLPTLEPAGQVVAVSIGCVLLLLALAIFYFPPHRTTEEVNSCDCCRKTTTTEVDASSVVIALLTAGVALVAFGVNGVQITKLSSPMVVLGSEPTGEVPARDIKGATNVASAADAPAAAEPIVPNVPPAFSALLPESKKVLRTLWKHQKATFGEDVSRRWTFAILPQAPNYAEFTSGLTEVLKKNLVGMASNFQCALTNSGIDLMKTVPSEELAKEDFGI